MRRARSRGAPRSSSSPRTSSTRSQAFEQGALDYLVKPFDEARLADTVQRLQTRLAAAAARRGARRLDAVLDAAGRPSCSARGDGARRAAPAMDQGVGRRERAPDPGRAGRLPALRREVHAGGLGGRRGADPQDDPRARRRARPGALRADPPLGDRQPAPGGAGRPRPQRHRRGAAEGPQRACCRSAAASCTCSGRCERPAGAGRRRLRGSGLACGAVSTARRRPRAGDDDRRHRTTSAGSAPAGDRHLGQVTTSTGAARWPTTSPPA